MSAKPCGVLLITCMIAGCGGHATQDVGALHAMQRVNHDHDLPLPTKYARLSRLAGAFEGAIDTFSDSQLRDTFDASAVTSFYATLSGAPDADARLDRLKETYDELLRRDLVTDSDTLDLFEQLISLRRFDAADALKRSSNVLRDRSIPVVHFANGFDTSERATMTLRPDGTWNVANVHLAARSVIAVVGCANSADAVSNLAKDAALMRDLDDASVIWLTDSSTLAMEGLVAWWNAELPNQPVQVAWRNDAWTGIDFSAMPSFHYLRNGRVIRRQAGDEPSTPREIRVGLEALSASP